MSKGHDGLDVTCIRGVVFDLDGTLVDSQLDFDAIRNELDFPRGQPILEHLATLTDKRDIDRAWQVIHRHELAGSRAARWMPGAQLLLQQLIAIEVPMAILTRNMRRATWLTIQSLNIPIELVLTREDCKPKPDPEGLLRIAQQWQLDCTSMVYIGDHLFDIQAANNANMTACLYRNRRHRPGDSASVEQADWVIAHFDQLTAAFNRSDPR